MAIISLQRRMAHKGRIRMGRKEGKRPVKLNNWRLTSTDKTALEEASTLYGGTVKAWAERAGEFELITDVSELPVMLLPGQTISQYMELWSGGGCQRRCDGAHDTISDGPCLCDADEPECKPITRLNVMLPDLRSLGMWRLDSTGWNAAAELAGTAEFLEQATARGVLLPARLRIDQRVQVKDGQTKKFGVPVLDVDVRSLDALQIAGVSLRELDAPTAPVAAIEPVRAAGLPSGYTPIAELERGGVSVEDGLAAVARESSPRIPNGRSPAPLGPVADIEFGAGAIPVEQPEPIDANDSTDKGAVSRGEAKSAGAQAVTAGGSVDQAAGTEAPIPQPPPNVAGAPTKAQVSKLGVLVRKLRDGGQIRTEHLWAALAKSRSYDTDQMIELLEGRDEDGVLHFGPLLATLTRPEASELIDRLSQLETKAAA